jgi:hypothetical protein
MKSSDLTPKSIIYNFESLYNNHIKPKPIPSSPNLLDCMDDYVIDIKIISKKPIPSSANLLDCMDDHVIDIKQLPIYIV